MRRFLFPLTFCASLTSASFAFATGYTGKVLYLLDNSGFSNVQYGGGYVQQTSGGGQVVGRGAPGSSTSSNALLWTGPSAATNLNPSGFGESFAYASSGTQQVGLGNGNVTGGNNHALLWNGSAITFADLNPNGFTTSVAYGTNGLQQVGSGRTTNDGSTHALLWNGLASTAADLNPATLIGYSTSEAINTDGLHQVGKASGTASNGSDHAMLWSGTSNTAVDLNPSGFILSRGFGVSDNQEVGIAQANGGSAHAMLWTGSAASAIDLNPTGQGTSAISLSTAYATNGSVQAGWGFGAGTGAYNHAYMWSGTADSASDLQSILPLSGGTWAQSFAYSIDSAGNIFGTATGTYSGNFGTFAVEWSPVPEPGSPALLAGGAAGLLCRRKRHT